MWAPDRPAINEIAASDTPHWHWQLQKHVILRLGSRRYLSDVVVFAGLGGAEFLRLS